MDLLALVFIWPFLILALGLAIIALGDIATFGLFEFSTWLWPLAIIALFILLPKLNRAGKEGSQVGQLILVRMWVIVLSIALLLPVFTRYLVATFSGSLGSIIAALILGFAMVVSGIFMSSRRALMYGSIVGGALSILWVYSQLWSLGEFARVIAAGFGLAVAVAIAVIKLRDKLS